LRICAAYHTKIKSKLSKSLFDAFQMFGLYMVSPTLRLREDLCRISAPVYFAAEAQPESQAAHCQPSDKIKL
jgi:hypothetical protein